MQLVFIWRKPNSKCLPLSAWPLTFPWLAIFIVSFLVKIVLAHNIQVIIYHIFIVHTLHVWRSKRKKKCNGKITAIRNKGIKESIDEKKLNENASTTFYDSLIIFICNWFIAMNSILLRGVSSWRQYCALFSPPSVSLTLNRKDVYFEKTAYFGDRKIIISKC